MLSHGPLKMVVVSKGRGKVSTCFRVFLEENRISHLIFLIPATLENTSLKTHVHELSAMIEKNQGSANALNS